MPKPRRETGNGSVIVGTNSDDTLFGFGGSYILSGGKGNDTYYIDDPGDEIDEKNNGGIDTVVSLIDWQLGDHVENLVLDGSGDLTAIGNASDNEITGNAGANTIDGGDGDDVLHGGAGDDSLIGGGGSDLIDGGEGGDTAVFSGLFADYQFQLDGDGLRVTSLAGEIDILRNVEYLSFADVVVAISDIGGGEPVPALSADELRAVDDDAPGTEDTAIDIPVLQNDIGQGFWIVSATNGAMGSVSVNGDGTVTYSPFANANGSDNFTYTITDSTGLTSTATVSVSVAAVNDAPVASGDSYTANANEVLVSSGSVLTNDVDPDGDQLRIIGAGTGWDFALDEDRLSGTYLATTTAGGSVEINADGTFSYTPLAGFTGSDSFNYMIDDGNGGQAGATATLTVRDASTPPYYVEGLIYGEPYRLNYPDPVGSATVVTYSFLTNVPDYYSSMHGVREGFLAFSEQQQQATREILDAIEAFTGLTFVETATDQAGITFGLADLSGYDGLAYRPNGDGVGTTASDVWIDVNLAGTTFTSGTQAYVTLLHELGHALGLEHPDLPAGEENQQYTVMDGMPHPTFSAAVTSYQLYDVAALQYLYGAELGYRLGDDVYDFAVLAGEFTVIWDAGGRDLIDMSAATYSVRLDLAEGSFSTVAATGSNNLAIAFGTAIEDATGSPYDDQLTGNDLANNLAGGGGDDVLTGRVGADTFVFASKWGADTITDFTRGEDVLDFAAAGLSYGDLTFAPSDGDMLITYQGDSVLLLGVDAIDDSDLLLV